MTSPVMVAPTLEENLRSGVPATTPSAVLYGVCGLLLFGPMAFGAVEPWSVFVLQCGTALLFLLWATRAVTNSDLQIAGNPLFLPMTVFGTMILLQLAMGLTANRSATTSEFLLYCSYGGLCFLTVQCLRTSGQAKILAVALSASGFAIAAFALLQGIAPNGKLYWLLAPRFGSWIYGPYVNHNHYAGLIEMLAPIPLVIVFSQRVELLPKIAAGVAAVIMVSTIFLSGSRGGMIAFGGELLLLMVLLSRRHDRQRPALALVAFLFLAAGFTFWLGGTDFLGRIASVHNETKSELSGGTRLAIDRDSLRMFIHKPALGSGLGTFADVYPQYRSFYTNFLVDKAHNDYLQLLVETGMLGFLVMLWFLIVIYRAALKKLRTRPMSLDSDVSMAMLLGISGILIHSLFDFNLHIPANAAFFYVFCTIAAMEPRFSMREELSPKRAEHTRH